MEQSVFSFLWGQLAYQVPSLLVYAVGAVGALALLRRHQAAALSCLIGCVILLVTSLSVTGIHAFLLQQRMGEGMPMVRYGQLTSIIGIVSSIGHAIGFALVVIAVFVGRGSAPAATPDRAG